MDKTKIGKFICGVSAGDSNQEDSFHKILSGLSLVVDDYYELLCLALKSTDTKQFHYVTPLYARSLLEAGCSALLARIDPLRVALASNAQEHADYDANKKQPSSIKWAGDIVPPHDAKNKQKEWNPTTSPKDLPRTLLGFNSFNLAWSSSFTALSDYAKNRVDGSPWLDELLLVEPDNLEVSFVSEIEKIYSVLSKGVHPEFICRRHEQLDKDTLLDLSERTVKILSKLATLSHFSKSFNSGLPFEEAINLLKQVEKDVSNDC